MTKKVGREQIVFELTNRFFGSFLRTKNRDWRYIEEVVKNVLPVDFEMNLSEYLRSGIDKKLFFSICFQLTKRIGDNCRRGPLMQP